MMDRDGMQRMTENREVWVDSVKVFACLTVLVGHLVQGLYAAGIFANHSLFHWFNQVLNAFQVVLFFVCSGYLYQKYSHVRDIGAWKQNIVKKLLDLGIPYVSFTVVFWLIKKLIPGAGSNGVQNLWENLVLEPIPPFWYLYILFWCFFVTPTFRSSKKIAPRYAMSLLLVYVGRALVPEDAGSAALRYFIFNYTWFLAGMGFAMVKPERIPKAKWLTLLLMTCFLVISYLHRNTGDRFAWFLCSILSSSAIILVNFGKEKQSGFGAFMTPYTMPIFLMHTVFIAVCRILLLKLGVVNLWMHLVLGVAFGLGGPIVAAKIMKRLKYTEFFLYPRKFMDLR